jgi:hypothetical protein
LLAGERQAGHVWYEPDAALAALAELDYAMHELGERPRLPAEQIKQLLPAEVDLPGRSQAVPTPPQAVFHLAEQAGLLLTGLWHTARTPAEMPDPYRDEKRDPWDPLPAPPPTGWEQATFMAAGLAEPPDGLVRAMLGVNPALAGRCLDEGAAPVGPDTRRLVQQALRADLADPALHRRTRLQAGQVLAAIGDPRFTPVEVNGVTLIRPDLVAVPGGLAILGSRGWPWDRQALANERPRHPVEVAAFYLGCTPQTNAEYACFITAGGYNNQWC